LHPPSRARIARRGAITISRIKTESNGQLDELVEWISWRPEADCLTIPQPHPPQMNRPTIARGLLITWLVTAAWDFVCASALTVLAYKGTFGGLWRGVASTAFGQHMLTAGTSGVFAGLGAHLSIAFVWSAIFVSALAASAGLRRIVNQPMGALAVACLYGPIIWLVMSLGIIPLLTGRPPSFSYRWWVQVFAHVPFVTLPLVFTARRTLGLAKR
jgi:hypothetical protein